MSHREHSNETVSRRPSTPTLSLRSRLYTAMLLIGLSLCSLLCIVTYFGNMQRWGGLIDARPATVEQVEHFAVEEAWRSTASTMMVLLLIILVVDRVISSHVIRPLNEMMKVLARRSAGNNSAYIRLPDDDQMGRLGDRINAFFDSTEQFDFETRKRALVAERTEHAVVICDDKGYIEWVNDAFTATNGFTLSESVGRRPGELLQGPQSDQGTLAYMRECLSMRVPFQVEVLNYRKTGESYWNSLEVRPIFDAEGRLQNYMSICRDITQIKETQKKYDEMVRDVLSARAQLEEQTVILQLRNDELNDARRKAETAMRAKSEFLANMSHEIRTPMTAILGFAGIMLEGLRDPNMVQAAQTIQRNGEYLLELINDILDLSKIEAGALRIENIPCGPTQIVDDVVGLMKYRADEKALVLNVKYEGTTPEQILTDPTRLRQILLNLLGNAVKFTSQGDVQLYIRSLGGDTPRLQFEVRDTGIGMTAEQLARLFQPFTQADNSTTRRFGGTGLGLSISKRLAEMLGGTITVCSAPSKGSSFTLTIAAESAPLIGPRLPEERKEVQPVEDKNAAREIKLPYRILLAEDGPDNQRLITYVLQRAEAQVVVADNGWIALNVAREAMQRGEPFDCILMDVQMPVMDGFQATQELRRERYKGPILALTANAMSHDRKLCLDAGCDDYATKPIERRKLLEMIERHVGAARAASQHQELCESYG